MLGNPRKLKNSPNLWLLFVKIKKCLEFSKKITIKTIVFSNSALGYLQKRNVKWPREIIDKIKAKQLKGVRIVVIGLCFRVLPFCKLYFFSIQKKNDLRAKSNTILFNFGK